MLLLCSVAAAVAPATESLSTEAFRSNKRKHFLIDINNVCHKIEQCLEMKGPFYK